MSMEAEILADRKRLKRKLRFWRWGALAFLALFVFGGLFGSSGLNGVGLRKDHIARVTISGVISDSRKQQEMLKKIAKSRKVKAVILRINSPGGTTTGGEALYEHISALRKKKPVVAVFGTVAASAAYMAAMGADHIVARANSITGSVGVIFQWAEVTGLLKNIGVKVEEIKSGPLKATPSPFQPSDEAGLQVAREMVNESFNWFIALVAKRRGIEPDKVPGLREGRIYSGRRALEFGLIDEIGGEDAAIAWLEKKRGIKKKLPVRDWKPKRSSRLSFLTSLVYGVGRMMGFDGQALMHAVALEEMREHLELNGLVSLWRPPLGAR